MTMDELRSQIAAWRGELPLWQEYTLRRLGQRDELTHEELEPVYRSMLVAEGLGEPQEKVDDFRPDYAVRHGPPVKGALRILKVSNTRGINALCDHQMLPLAANLTVIYGVNASGKSGYGRLFRAACGELDGCRILRDAFSHSPIQQSAEIEVQTERGGETITYRPEAPCPHLFSIRYFDAEVAAQHLRSATELDLAPAEMRVFDRLARIVDQVRQRRDQAVSERRAELAKPIPGSFSTVTKAGMFVLSLSPRSSLEELDTLCALSQDEEERFAALSQEVLKLRDTQANEAAERGKLDQEHGALAALLISLRSLEEALSQAALQELTDAREGLARSELVNRQLSSAQFKTTALNCTATPEWERFIQAARQLALAEEHERATPYPGEGDVCLLCQQTLSDTARKLLDAYWRFLESDAGRKLAETKDRTDALSQALARLDFRLLDGDRQAASYIRGRRSELLDRARDSLAALQNRRDAFAQYLISRSDPPEGPPPQLPTDEFEALVGVVAAEVEATKPDAVRDRLREVERERDELADRKGLAVIRSEVERRIADHQALKRLQDVRLDTTPVSNKQRSLSEEIVTARYLEAWDRECVTLDCNLRVRLSVRARKGQSVCSLELDGAEVPCPAVVDVLSEGEQRHAALAKFLAEVHCDDSVRGVVMDDPAAWLDHWRKERLAKRLAAEAETRQVIVLTHDLVFLHLLKVCAVERKLKDVSYHWIQRGGDGTPGVLSCDDGPAREERYDSVYPAQQAHDAAKKTTGTDRQVLIEKGFGALRIACEYLIVHKMLQRVVTRYEERLRVDNLPKVLVPHLLAERVVELHGRLSRRIDAHLRADSASGPPTLEELQSHIREVEGLLREYDTVRKRLKAEQQQAEIGARGQTLGP